MRTAIVVAIVGAESTGKTTLAHALSIALRSTTARRVVMVDEYLRAWCAAHRRTPFVHEQGAIAAEQTRRIAEAAADDAIVVADTTALMTAVYSDDIFDDRSLYPSAIAAHRHAALTLLTGLDVPWQPDGLQRDGPHVRVPVDAKVRAALNLGAVDYGVLYGSDDDRRLHALAAVRRLFDRSSGSE